MNYFYAEDISKLLNVNYDIDDFVKSIDSDFVFIQSTLIKNDERVKELENRLQNEAKYHLKNELEKLSITHKIEGNHSDELNESGI